jgi:uncharacterized protein (TIRG00374 family)
VRSAVVLGTNLVVGGGGLAYVLYRFGTPAMGLLAMQPHAGLLVAFVSAVAAAFAGYALRWRMLLGALGVRQALARLAAYRAAGQSLSWLLPSARLAGEPLRAFLLARDQVAAPSAIATVAVDRTLEMAAAAPFTLVYATVLLRGGVPELQGAFVTVTIGVVALVVGIGLGVRRLRRGAGLVTALARSTGLDRLRLVHSQMGVLGAAETDATRLVAQRGRLGRAFAVGVCANLLVLLEYGLLLAAFGLPAGPLAVVGAIFAAGAAHSLPVPAAVGVLEGAQMWLFSALGHPPEVGLAVGLAVRLRELVWVVPGLAYLAVRGLRPQTAAARNPG